MQNLKRAHINNPVTVNQGRCTAGSRGTPSGTPAAAARPAGRRAHLSAPLLIPDDLLILRGARTHGSGAGQARAPYCRGAPPRHPAACDAHAHERQSNTLSPHPGAPRFSQQVNQFFPPAHVFIAFFSPTKQRAARRAAPAQRGAFCPPRPSPAPPRALAPAPPRPSWRRPPPAPSPASPRAPAPPRALSAWRPSRTPTLPSDARTRCKG